MDVLSHIASSFQGMMTVPETGKVKHAKPVGALFYNICTMMRNRPTGRELSQGPDI